MFGFLNFSLIRLPLQAIYPFRGILILAALLLVNVGLFIIILKKVTQNSAQKINIIIAFVFFTLIIYNGVMAIPTIYRKMTHIRSENTDIHVNEQISTQNLPNIYYFIFDEYSSTKAIKRYYDYENTMLTDFFNRNNINYSENSNNRTPFTEPVIADLLNLRGVATEEMTHAELIDYIRNPYIYSLVLEHDYKINTASYVDFLNESQSTFKFTEVLYDYSGDVEIRTLILNNSIFYPISTRIVATLDRLRGIEIEDDYSRHKNIILSQFDYLSNSYDLTNSNLFTLAYFPFPHAPFLFDENGGMTPGQDRDNWQNMNAYLGQYIYCTKLIIETIESIIKNDPNSIIILQSDHSSRYLLHMHDRHGVPKTWLWDEEVVYLTSILNAVYYQGKELDIEDLSGTNTVIRVFNDVFGITIPYLDHSFLPPYERFADN